MTTQLSGTTGSGGIMAQLGGHGFFNFNVMLLLSTVLQNFSGALIQTSAVQAQTTLQESELAVAVSDAGMGKMQEDTAQLQATTNDYNNTMNQKQNKKNQQKESQDQATITELNTQFSLDLQTMNTNVQTAQGLSQGSETASQMTTSSLQGLSSLFGVVSQLESYISGLLQS